MISEHNCGPTFSSGKYPCGVCSKGVGANSIFCSQCKKWVHKTCSGINGRLDLVINFRCKTCVNPPEEIRLREKTVTLGGNNFDVVNQFCYLGDMLGAGGGAETSTVARIRSGWKKFRELLPLLTSRVISHKVKGRLYNACVRSVILYGSETWPLKEEDIQRICRTDNMMVRWICGVTLRDRKSSKELRDRLGLEDIRNMLRRNRLRWFGHVERMNEENPANRCRSVEVNGRRGVGRPCKTWAQLVSKDMRELRIRPGLAQDREAWKRATR